MSKIVLWTGKITPHNVYRWLIDHPPVEYAQPPIPTGWRRWGRLLWMVRTRLRNLLGKPKLGPSLQGVDLVHSAQHLMKGPGRWVVDMADHFLGFGYTRRFHHVQDPSFIRQVAELLAQPSCKAILPMNRTIAESVVERIPELRSKVHVVYPALPPRQPNGRRYDSSRPLRILFVGNGFALKGGEVALKTWEHLALRGGFEMTMVCADLPDEWRRRVAAQQGGLTLLPPPATWWQSTYKKLGFPYRHGVSRQQMESLFQEADLFFLPEWMDSMAVYLEAKAWALPVVGPRHSYAAELIRDGVDGRLIDFPQWIMGSGVGVQWNTAAEFLAQIDEETEEHLAEQFAATIAEYRSHPETYEQHSAAALEEVLSGRFSIDRRNQTLRSIYAEALQ